MLTNFSQQTNNWFVIQSWRFHLISELRRLRSEPIDSNSYQIILMLKSALKDYDTLLKNRDSHYTIIGSDQSIIGLRELFNY